MSGIQNQIIKAESRIRSHIRETPLDFSSHLTEMSGSMVFLKLENLQHTGSFKVRGALNKLFSLTPEQRAAGVVAASSGNHGIAVAYGASLLKIKAIIFIPKNASTSKAHAVREYGVDVRLFGSDCADTETHARAYAQVHRMTYISPYNDLQVIGGQGTIGLEISRQLESIDAVFVSVGGGGLISGVGGYLKANSDRVKVIGCTPERSCVMYKSMLAGRVLADVESLDTLSDGTAGGIETGAITFDYCRTIIDEFVLVSESEIRNAMLLFIETHHLLIEGAAGVVVAAFLKRKQSFQGQNVVIVICGANIGLKDLKSIL